MCCDCEVELWISLPLLYGRDAYTKLVIHDLFNTITHCIKPYVLFNDILRIPDCFSVLDSEE